MKTFLRLCVVVLFLSLARSLQAEVPRMIHYQGFVTDGTGKAYTGNGYFKFALVNASGATTYWNFDGSATAAGAEPPGTAVKLGVLRGLFSVLLGDTAVPNMILPIDPVIFADHTQVYLRLWFSETLAGPYAQVIPDTRIVSVGYAMVAQMLVDGAITGPELAPAVTLGGTAGKGELTVKSAADQSRAILDAGAAAGGGSLALLEADGVTEAAKLVAHEAGKGGGQLSLKNGSGQLTVEIDGQDGTSTSAGALVNLKKGDGSRTVSLQADLGNGNGALVMFDGDGSETVRLTGAENGTQGGFLGLKNLNGESTIQLSAQDGAPATAPAKLRMKEADGTVTAELSNEGSLKLSKGDGTQTVQLKADIGSGNGGLLMYDPNGGESVRFSGAFQGTGAGVLQFKNLAGVVTMSLKGDSNGEGRLTTQVVEITGGADLSEQFNITTNENSAAEPGMIVCIDAERPGELRVSHRPYDATVAGIISGAGGVRPGMLMGQAGTLAHGQHPVALTGRVYCRVDAGFGAIKPGDLITTSSIPGHGMKADPARGAGAILGKAMTPLKAGRGLVLVLVSLQ